MSFKNIILLILNLIGIASFAQESLHLDSMQHGRYGFGFEHYKGNFYSIGGFSTRIKKDGRISTSKAYKTVEKYDIKNNKWSTVLHFDESQIGFDSELVNGKIYMFGNYSTMKTSQVYDTKKNTIEKIKPLPMAHYWSTTESYKDKVYVIGGYDSRDLSFLNVVQVYDTKTDAWSFIPMPLGKKPLRFMKSSVKWKHYFFVWGRNVMLRYDILNNTWLEIKQAKNFIDGCQEAILINDKIYITGGSYGAKGAETSTDIIIFDPKTNNFSRITNILKHKRHYAYGLTYDKDYLYIVGGREHQSWDAINKIERIPLKTILAYNPKTHKNKIVKTAKPLKAPSPIAKSKNDSSSTDLTNIASSSRLVVYPNPINLDDYINLKYPFELDSEYQIYIIDNLLYQKTNSFTFKPISNTHTFQVRKHINYSGVFIINLIHKGKLMASSRIIVKD